MFKLISFILIASSLSTFSEAYTKKTIHLDANIITVKNFEDLKHKFPESEIHELHAIDSLRGQIRYTLGNRVNGDRLVARGQDSGSWATPQNIQLTLEYPQSGTGNVISYVEILVNQSSNVGRGYIVSGGIGQRQITIIIEAQSVTYFTYSASIYGL